MRFLSVGLLETVETIFGPVQLPSHYKAVNACLTLYLESYEVKGQEEECDARYYDYDSFVCVCTEERCDSPGEILLPQEPEVLLSVLTTKDELRFHVDTAPFRERIPLFLSCEADRMSNDTLPFIKEAKELSEGLLVIASPWSAPAWMKTNGNINGSNGGASLKPEYYGLWAQYYLNYEGTMTPQLLPNSSLSSFLNAGCPMECAGFKKDYYFFNWIESTFGFLGSCRFVQAYEAEGVQVWSLTSQNEPIFGGFPDFPFNCMGWTPEQQQEFVRDHLGPTLREAGYGNISLFIFDDQRYYIEEFVTAVSGSDRKDKTTFNDDVMSDATMQEWVSGVAMHWYMNFMPPDIQDTLHEMFPDLMLLGTEACNGAEPWEHQVYLGSWVNGEKYALDIIQNLNHWMVGWIDWNLALDLQGGPNWAGFYVDSPIVVNATAGEYYKNPSYYAMGHFSKFIPRDSLRVGIEVEDGTGSLLLDGTAVLTPQGHIAVVLLNRNETELAIRLEEGGLVFETSLPPKSMATLVWVASE
ncbi:unnamed protein product [Darwinula stevensoni]|uniref:Glucosylceramidase n=1 Tax=Darwinula stevensoni TaxID=69355 RepID=A0A7R8ZZ13_9CRUS|nr:unnamed protein product [Darwinula stevensoni]CAG0882579.1 unnamed protein product [Darwinula stevensoni]